MSSFKRLLFSECDDDQAKNVVHDIVEKNRCIIDLRTFTAQNKILIVREYPQNGDLDKHIEALKIIVECWQEAPDGSRLSDQISMLNHLKSFRYLHPEKDEQTSIIYNTLSRIVDFSTPEDDIKGE